MGYGRTKAKTIEEFGGKCNGKIHSAYCISKSLVFPNFQLQILGGDFCPDPFCKKALGGGVQVPRAAQLRVEWVLTAEQREQAFNTHHAAGEEFWS